MSAYIDQLMALLPELAEATVPAGHTAAEAAERGLQRLRIAWPALVGPALAGVTRVAEMEMAGGMMHVQVEATWRNALFQNRQLVTARAHRVVPAVRGLRLHTAADGAFPRHQPPPSPAAEPPMPPEPQTEGIADPALRAAVDGLCRAWRTGGR